MKIFVSMLFCITGALAYPKYDLNPIRLSLHADSLILHVLDRESSFSAVKKKNF